MLYGENDFQITVGQYDTSDDIHLIKLSVENAYFTNENSSLLMSVWDFEPLPNMLLKVQQLSISIYLHKRASLAPHPDEKEAPDDFEQLNYCLYFHSPDRNDGSVCVTLAIDDIYRSKRRFRSLAELADMVLPSRLLRVQRLTITIALEKAPPKYQGLVDERRFQDAHYQLYHVRSFLAESKRLKIVQIKVTTEGFPEFAAVAAKLLWPLVKLPSTANTTIVGVSEATTERLLAEMQQHQSGNNLSKAVDFLHRARKLEQVLDVIKGKLYGSGTEVFEIISNDHCSGCRWLRGPAHRPLVTSLH
ncbi:uncharacterized protein LTR77_005988 [Saxophila tyrrhenica]|uniref:Uncharacterized protein n=1 Tax=Saxophila tyrrhenica TaxID=1690608 RepID=A0AAV9P9P2_9PEZI|nr:hypothetical protein LTR77_005988 [Saxophila tyrrhenica]